MANVIILSLGSKFKDNQVLLNRIFYGKIKVRKANYRRISYWGKGIFSF